MRIQLFGDLAFRHGADDIFHDFAALENHQARDAADTVLDGGVRIVIDVELADLDFAIVLTGDFLDDRGDHAAGSAPDSPEIDQDGDLGLQDFLVEAGEIRPYVNVFVGSDDVRSISGLDTPLSDGDVVSIIPAVAGG